MEITQTSALPPTESTEIWHKDYNLQNRDTIHELPEQSAVFAIFALIGDEPRNCRFVGRTENLREAVTTLFSSPNDAGLRIFMQGPWIKLLQYQLTLEATSEESIGITLEWNGLYHPKINADGEYPGYYE